LLEEVAAQNKVGHLGEIMEIDPCHSMAGNRKEIPWEACWSSLDACG
jgi:hypothetical protein